MGLLDNIKNKISSTLINKELKKKTLESRNFKDAFKKSFGLFIVMPANEQDFHHTFELLRFLDKNKKTLTIFISDFRVSLLPQPFRNRCLPFTDKDVSKLNLPSKELLAKIHEGRYNAVLDLNREDDAFLEYVVFQVESPLKVGFYRENADKYFNMQIKNNSEIAEFSYKNFVNCLSMF